MNASPLQWRHLAEGELDHERIWLSVTAGGALLAVSACWAGVQPPACFFHWATGFACPGCGSTRAILQLGRGHLHEAWMFNPMVTTAALGVVVYCLYAAVVLGLRLPRLRTGTLPRRYGVAARVGLIGAVLANWWWVVAHGW